MPPSRGGFLGLPCALPWADFTPLPVALICSHSSRDLLPKEQMATGEFAKMVEEAPEWLNDWAENVGTDLASGMAESPGWNVFAIEDGIVYHTHSRTAPDRFCSLLSTSNCSTRSPTAATPTSRFGATTSTEFTGREAQSGSVE